MLSLRAASGASVSLLHLLAERTVFQQTTAIAVRVARVTDLASVMNQIDVQRKLFADGNQRFDECVRLCVAAFRGQKFHPAQDAKDVRVHRENSLLTSKQQHAARRLRADAFERGEKREGFARGQIAQKRQVQGAAAGFEFVEDRFDDDGFDVRQATALDRSGNRCRARAASLFPIWEAFFQTGERTMTVHVRRGLRQNRGDEFVEGSEIFKRGGCAVNGFEMLGDVMELLLLFVQI